LFYVLLPVTKNDNPIVFSKEVFVSTHRANYQAAQLGHFEMRVKELLWR
jgi:hypothetical protein